MDMKQLLDEYRWRVRERTALQRQLDQLNSAWFERPDPRGMGRFLQARERRRAACESRLAEEEARTAEDLDTFERLMGSIRHPRTRLVIRQYYGLGMSDQQIADADGFSVRTAGNIRRAWLREQEGGSAS